MSRVRPMTQCVTCRKTIPVAGSVKVKSDGGYRCIQCIIAESRQLQKDSVENSSGFGDLLMGHCEHCKRKVSRKELLDHDGLDAECYAKYGKHLRGQCHCVTKHNNMSLQDVEKQLGKVARDWAASAPEKGSVVYSHGGAYQYRISRNGDAYSVEELINVNRYKFEKDEEGNVTAKKNGEVIGKYPGLKEAASATSKILMTHQNGGRRFKSIFEKMWYEEGIKAAKDGYTEDRCPYPYNSYGRPLWIEGFNSVDNNTKIKNDRAPLPGYKGEKVSICDECGRKFDDAPRERVHHPGEQASPILCYSCFTGKVKNSDRFFQGQVKALNSLALMNGKPEP